MGIGIVVTTGIKQSSNIGSALVSAMYDRSSELGLYTSAHLLDTLVAGLGTGGTIDGSCEPNNMKSEDRYIMCIVIGMHNVQTFLH